MIDVEIQKNLGERKQPSRTENSNAPKNSILSSSHPNLLNTEELGITCSIAYSTETAMEKSLRAATAELINEYQNLNAAKVEELSSDPSPLEFLQYVCKNRPFVLRQGAADWDACSKWTAQYLTSHLESTVVNIAHTPNGKADSPVEHGGKLLFVKPYEAQISFSEALSHIRRQEIDGTQNGPIVYAQTRRSLNSSLKWE
jgi:peptidyl-lysine (3S)-dioxygenase / protease